MTYVLTLSYDYFCNRKFESKIRIFICNKWKSGSILCAEFYRRYLRRIFLLQSGAVILILASSLCLESSCVAFRIRCHDKQFCALRSRKCVLLVSVRMYGRTYEAMLITSCFVIFYTVTKTDVISVISPSLPYSLLCGSRKIVPYSKGCHAIKPVSLNQPLLPLLYPFYRSSHNLMCVYVYKVKCLRWFGLNILLCL
jgi:hypothetical protein